MPLLLEQFLADLVAMRAVSNDIAATDHALDYIEAHLSACGMHNKRMRFNGHGALIATTRPNRKRTRVMLCAHVDVMTGSNDVFRLRKKGGKWLGRGTYDMQFAIAAYLQLVRDLKNHLSEYDFDILITSDEELGNYSLAGTRHVLEAGYLPQVAILPDGGTEWNVERLAKGHWRFDLIAHGRAAHSSRPWEGESASFKLLHALHELHDHFKHHGPDTDTLNIGLLEGGEAYNQIPSRMGAMVEIRLTEADSYERHKKLIDRLCQRYGITYHDMTVAPPTITDTSHPLIQAFMQSVAHVTGTHPGTCVSYGGSDGIFFSEREIPCILTRPVGGGHHGEDEWVDRDSLAQLTPILRDYLDRIARPHVTSVDKSIFLV